MENTFIPEAETVNVSAKFIIRDSTTSGRAHRETVCLVETEAMQRCTPREKGCGHPHSEEERCKKAVEK